MAFTYNGYNYLQYLNVDRVPVGDLSDVTNEVWTWGSNTTGLQLYPDAVGSLSFVPTSMPIPYTDIKKVNINVAGSVIYATLLTNAGAIWHWSSADPTPTLQDISGIGGTADDVATKGTTFFVKSSTGIWWAKGANINGSLGLGDETARATYTNTTRTWDDVRLPTSSGNIPAFAMGRLGKQFWAWGSLTSGTFSTPLLMFTIPTEETLQNWYVGDTYAYIMTDVNTYVYGYNYNNQLAYPVEYDENDQPISGQVLHDFTVQPNLDDFGTDLGRVVQLYGNIMWDEGGQTNGTIVLTSTGHIRLLNDGNSVRWSGITAYLQGYTGELASRMFNSGIFETISGEYWVPFYKMHGMVAGQLPVNPMISKPMAVMVEGIPIPDSIEKTGACSIGQSNGIFWMQSEGSVYVSAIVPRLFSRYFPAFTKTNMQNQLLTLRLITSISDERYLPIKALPSKNTYDGTQFKDIVTTADRFASAAEWPVQSAITGMGIDIDNHPYLWQDSPMTSGNSNQTWNPVKLSDITSFPSTGEIDAIYMSGSPAGTYTNVCMTAPNGDIYTFGGNAYGELGIGNSSIQYNVVLAHTTKDWTKYGVQAGIKTNGTLWTWGFNLTGQLGTGTTVSRSSPVQVGTVNTWKDVSIPGREFGLALRTDGTLWAAGMYATSGTNVRSSSFVQVGSATDWKHIIRTSEFGFPVQCVVKNNGEIWYVSINTSTFTNQIAYTGTTVHTDWTSLHYGQYMRSDGSLWRYSIDSTPVGVVTTISSPVQVGSDTGWIKAVDIGGIRSSRGSFDIYG